MAGRDFVLVTDQLVDTVVPIPFFGGELGVLAKLKASGNPNRLSILPVFGCKSVTVRFFLTTLATHGQAQVNLLKP